MFNRKSKTSSDAAPLANHTPPHRVPFRHQRAIFVFVVLGLVVLFSTAVLWGHFDQIVTSYVWMARAGLAVVDVIAVGLAIWHLYARYAPLKVWCFIGEAIIATTMLVHAGAVLQLDSSGAQATANVKTAAAVQAQLESARVKAAGEAAAAIRLTTGSSRLAGQALQQGAQDKSAAAQIVQAASRIKPTTFLSDEYMAGGMFYWPALIALACFLIAMAISGFALPIEDANNNGVPDHLERAYSQPKAALGFVAPAQASIPRPRRYVRPDRDATARVETTNNAAPLDALAATLAKLGAVNPTDPPTDPPTRAVKQAAPVGEINPPTNPPTDPPEAGGWPELPDIQWEHKRDGVMEAWYAPEGKRNRVSKIYLGRIGKRQLDAWQQLAPAEFEQAVCEWVEQKRAAKL